MWIGCVERKGLKGGLRESMERVGRGLNKAQGPGLDGAPSGTAVPSAKNTVSALIISSVG